jgi:hypothetical protein
LVFVSCKTAVSQNHIIRSQHITYASLLYGAGDELNLACTGYLAYLSE